MNGKLAPNSLRELITILLRLRTVGHRYKPLPEPSSLRLLEIHPLTPDSHDLVKCSLRTYRIHDAPPYNALSYTWGSPLSFFSARKNSDSYRKLSQLQKAAAQNPAVFHAIDGRRLFDGKPPTDLTRCFPILCNGEVIYVTANLNDALKMLSASRFKRQRHIWIDALCIDQENIAERNQQVGQMSQIFERAESVIVWLGEEDEFCDDALTVVETLSHIPENAWGKISYTDFYHPEQCYRKLGVEPLTFRNWLGFLAFMLRSWFTRTWVVQELALGKHADAICGSRVVPWSKISHALRFIRATRWYHHLSTEKMRHLKGIRKYGIYGKFLRSGSKFDFTPLWLDRTRLAIQMGAEQKLSTSLQILMDTHRDTHASNPRDKVYAFLGIANKTSLPFTSGHNYIVPDYESPVEQVFADATRSLMLSYQSLNLLSHVEDASGTTTPNLPSWVPDFAVGLNPYPLRFRGNCKWSASGKLDWKPNHRLLKENLLEVQGFRVDTISATSILPNETEPQVSNDHMNVSAWKRRFRASSSGMAWSSILALTLSTPPVYPLTVQSGHPITRFEAFWRTLISNTYARGYPAPAQVGRLFVDYILHPKISPRPAPRPNHIHFQPRQELTSGLKDLDWHQIFSSEPEGSEFGLSDYRARHLELKRQVSDGTYSPIGLAQLQHEIEATSGIVRRVFRTEGALLGCGAKSLRVGDEIWILAGANVPLVLRRLDEESGLGRYKLVGEAYVHGVMHGEALKLGKDLQVAIIE